MAHYSTVMSQLLDLLPRHEFGRIVKEHRGDDNVKKFSCYQQLIVLLYAQLRGLDSLREIETTLGVHSTRWYHLGLKTVRRSTLADANTTRPWQIYEALYYRLLERCKSFTRSHGFRVPNPIVSMDATTIELCLGLYPWANYQNTKGAVKLHCLLDHAGLLPTRIEVTGARDHEIKVAKRQDFTFEPDSIVLMDRGFADYSWYQHLTSEGVWFVTRAKKNINYMLAGQHNRPKKKGIVSDQNIRFAGPKAQKDYPGRLRLITVLEPKTRKRVRILTNNFDLCANTIAELYRERWQVETFFKWIKEHLKIKTFLGTNQNAVLTQIWVAMCAYLLLCYIRFKSRFGRTPLELSRIIRETLLSPYTIIDILRTTPNQSPKPRSPDPQMQLFP